MGAAQKFVTVAAVVFAVFSVAAAQNGTWKIIPTVNLPVARHEACFVFVDNMGYLLGGRKVKNTSRFDPTTSTWTTLKVPPQGEFHHMQCVAYQGKIWIAGGWYGSTHEQNHKTMFVYDPATDTWDNTVPYLPNNPERRRGSAAFVLNPATNKMYLSHGNIGGHGEFAETQVLFDEFDPATKTWKSLPDAPNGRDRTSSPLDFLTSCLCGLRF
jgi:large repetitive protein